MQLGLAGAAQLIVIIRTCTEKGKTTTFRTYFVTSRPADRLSPLQILFLRRGQWGIEATCHQRLDVSLHEDKSRVRTLSSVAVLGLLSRISLALFQQDCQRPQSLDVQPPVALLRDASSSSGVDFLRKRYDTSSFSRRAGTGRAGVPALRRRSARARAVPAPRGGRPVRPAPP